MAAAPAPTTGPRIERGDRRWAALLALWAAALAAWLLVSGARVTREDGFYYFQIARNVARGLGSTFDGAHPTNGYHPLWLALLVPVYRLFPGVAEGLAAAIGVQGALFAAGAVLLHRLLRRMYGAAVSVMGVVVWSGLAYRESVGGLEFALHGVCLLAAMLLALGWGDGARERWRAPALGLALAACVLVRLDNVVLAALVCAWCAARDRAAPRWGRLAAIALPPLIALAGYAAWSTWAFGHPTPVSSAVKREWSQYLLLQDPAYARGGVLLAKLRQLAWPFTALPMRYPLVLAVGGYGAAVALAVRESGLRRLLPFAAWSAVQVAAAALWFHGEVAFLGAPWYFVVQPVVAVLLLAGAVARLHAARPRLGDAVAWGAAAVAAAGIAVEAARWHARDPQRVTYEAAGWARAHVPPDAVLASWHAGAVGYLSERRVLNLDGLVNSWDFHLRRRADLCAYWQEENVAYVVDMFHGARPAVYEPALASFAACRDRLQPAWASSYAMGPWRVAAFRLQ